MPLWLVFTLSYLIFAGALAGAVWYFLQLILPVINAGSEEFLFVGGQVIAAGGGLLVVLGLLFLTLTRMIGAPARRLTRAVDAFAEKGERIPVVIPTFVPREVRRLMMSFVTLIKVVENTHQHDAEVSRVKSDFISTAAHQLRTPLTGIRWAMEALERGDITEEQRALIKNATDKSRELVAIVGTLLDISAIESGKYQYKIAPVDVVALVDEVMKDFSVQANERSITMSLKPLEAIPLVQADRERIKWVLTNLIENAIRYTPDRGAVRVGIGSSRDRVMVSVRDTGIGISSADRGNIFERFYRGRNAVEKENEGNGLGLYIARTIATDHGGDLNFSANAEGPGTTFTLSLPIHGPSGR